jgi:hypothetical protein
MTVDWNGYKPFDPGVDGPLNKMSRKEARHAYDRLMAAKSDRVEALRDLLAANGLRLSESNEDVRALNTWFRDNVDADTNGRWIMNPLWYAVANDIALFLGDLLLKRQPTLRWDFFVWGKRDTAYQRHVIMGFDVPNPNYNIDVTNLVVMHGIMIVEGRDSRVTVFENIVNAGPD